MTGLSVAPSLFYRLPPRPPGSRPPRNGRSGATSCPGALLPYRREREWKQRVRYEAFAKSSGDDRNVRTAALPDGRRNGALAPCRRRERRRRGGVRPLNQIASARTAIDFAVSRLAFDPIDSVGITRSQQPTRSVVRHRDPGRGSTLRGTDDRRFATSQTAGRPPGTEAASCSGRQASKRHFVF